MAGQPGPEPAASDRADLRALHAWNRPNLSDADLLLRYDTAPEDTAHAQMLTEAALSWSRKYPAVTMYRDLTTHRAADAIVAATSSAQLVVLGARGHAQLPGRRLGSVSHAVLHHAACPVAVVH